MGGIAGAGTDDIEDILDDILTAVGNSRDFFFDAVNGDITGTRIVQVAGNNPGLTIDTIESINNIRLATGTGSLYPYLNADTTVYISSSNASDTQTVVVVGLDTTYTDVTRLVTLSGQTPVAVTGDVFRVFAIAIISSPIAVAVGDIYLSTDNTDITNGVPNILSNVLSKIDSGFTQGVNGNRTIPASTKGNLFSIVFNSSKGADADIFLRFRSDTDDDFSISPPFQLFQNSEILNVVAGTALSTKTDIDVIAQTPTDNSKITVAFFLALIDTT